VSLLRQPERIHSVIGHAGDLVALRDQFIVQVGGGDGFVLNDQDP